MMDMEEEKKKRRRRLLLLLAALLLIIGGIWLKQLVTVDDPPESVISGELLPKRKDAHEMTADELADYTQQMVDKSRFNMVIRPTGTVAEGSLEGELEIQNPKTNAYPINVQLQEKTTGEIIYSTGAIQPGEEVTTIHLEHTLSKGDHETVAIFSVYDPKTEKLLGKTTASVTMTVK